MCHSASKQDTLKRISLQRGQWNNWIQKGRQGEKKQAEALRSKHSPGQEPSLPRPGGGGVTVDAECSREWETPKETFLQEARLEKRLAMTRTRQKWGGSQGRKL